MINHTIIIEIIVQVICIAAFYNVEKMSKEVEQKISDMFSNDEEIIPQTVVFLSRMGFLIDHVASLLIAIIIIISISIASTVIPVILQALANPV